MKLGWSIWNRRRSSASSSQSTLGIITCRTFAASFLSQVDESNRRPIGVLESW